ncbi:Vitamin B12 import ATP-binding protein BtuD [Streptomyces glaucescens]
MTTDTATRTALVELTDVGKRYGNVRALEGVSLKVHAGEITCVLGDNGAGKSTLIKIIAGLHQHDGGTLRIEGEETRLSSPREALDRGIATVYQDLAVVPLMPVWRNFFLGSEPRKGVGPFKRMDVDFMRSRPRRTPPHGHRRLPRRRPARRHPLRRRAPVRRDRAGGVLRREGPDPGRADGRARA